MKNTAKILGTIFFLYCGIVNAQKLDIKIVQQGEGFSDSSYYDIIKIADKYWVAGKYGILKTIDKEANLSNIPYQSRGVDIYKLDLLDKNNLIAAADKGIVYKYNLPTGQWKSIEVKGYQKSCFYNLTVVDSQTAYICGGNSAIAHSQKRIPKGFILKSTDGGLTWKEVYHSLFKMIWCVKWNPFDKKIYALMYSPNKTYLYKEENGAWEKVGKIGNSIFHEIQFENAQDYIATGGWMSKDGRVYSATNKTVIPKAGLIWGRISNDKYELLTACRGQVVLGNKHGNFQLFDAKLNKPFSIYEAIFTSENTALAIGSGRTILQLTIHE